MINYYILSVLFLQSDLPTLSATLEPLVEIHLQQQVRPSNEIESVSHESKCLTWEKYTGNLNPNPNPKASRNPNPNPKLNPNPYLMQKTADWLITWLMTHLTHKKQEATQ